MTRRAIPSPKRRGEPVVIFRVGAQRFLMSSSEIEEVRDLPFGSMPAAVAIRGKIARQVPVVSAAGAFGLPSAAAGQLLVLRSCGVAVAIGEIECMSELREVVALPPGFRGKERSWYRGLALVEGQILPVVNPAMFAELSTPSARVATTGLAVESAILTSPAGAGIRAAKAGA